MERDRQYCRLHVLRAGAGVEYDRLHAAVFPEVEADLRAAGFHDYSIFRSAELVISVYRAPEDSARRGTNAGRGEGQRRWSDLVTPLFEESSGTRIERRAERVYRLD